MASIWHKITGLFKRETKVERKARQEKERSAPPKRKVAVAVKDKDKTRYRARRPHKSYPKEQTAKGAFGRNLDAMRCADAKKA